MKIPALIDKTSSFGTLFAAMSCAGCFPALGALGATLGIGFLSSYEGFLFRKLIPALVVLALVANCISWYRHRVVSRGLLSIAGPVAVLAALFAFWHYDWSIYLFYTGLGLMLTVSLLDIFHPVKKPQCQI
ncbi:MAG: organomercurial transporter MerC [Dokdonella sp.]|uniref:organomercurial transporter MerC n=1 Tax=Dokdonella sp. TaxID=2291710 RepID=UPI0031BE049C|nr:organomercurial transporter MerC [Xanthomonadales bacterium]